MKKCLCLIMSLVILLMIAGCAAPSVETPTQPTEKAPVLPPTRIGTGTMTVQLVKHHTFEEATEESDVIARIRIGDWLGETEKSSQTFFEAEVLECFKGEISQTFVLSQLGYSKCTIGSPAFPLFTSGNEFLVFLTEIPEDKFVDLNAKYEMYWLTGSYVTILDVSYDDSGNRYYAATYWGGTYRSFGETMDIPTNYTKNREIFNQIYANAIADDPIRAEIYHPYPYVFAEEDVIALIEQYK